MAENPGQWQLQLYQLQQELAIARREWAAARQREANWRQLYETEAQQRRGEAAIAQEKIAALEATLHQLQQPSPTGNSHLVPLQP